MDAISAVTVGTGHSRKRTPKDRTALRDPCRDSIAIDSVRLLWRVGYKD